MVGSTTDRITHTTFDEGKMTRVKQQRMAGNSAKLKTQRRAANKRARKARRANR